MKKWFYDEPARIYYAFVVLLLITPLVLRVLVELIYKVIEWIS